MANNSNNVAILKPNANGVVWYAPLGTPLPTAVGEALSPLYKTCGYIADDGIDKSDNYTAGDGKKAYGGDTVVNGTPSMAPSIKFTIIETGSADAMALAYNKSDISGEANNLSIALTDKTPDDCVMVFMYARDNNTVQLETYAHATFGSRDDIKRDDSTPDGVPVTWNFRKDSDGKYGMIYQGEKVSA